MQNINEILVRAAALRDETALNSISPERAGGIMYDTLLALNELWLQQGAALVISKIYASVAAMEADTAPVSDLTGQPLRPGQIVVIASSDSDNGSVYRYNGTDSPSWSLVGEIGNLEPVDSLDSDSTQLPLAAHQGKVLDGKISQLGQYIDNPEWVEVVPDRHDRVLYGVKTDGKFYFGDGCPPQVQEYVQNIIDGLGLDEYNDIVIFLGNLINGDTLTTLLNAKANVSEVAIALATKVDAVPGKTLIDADFASSQSANENPEYFEIKTDSVNKIIEAITTEGKKQINIPIDIPSVMFDSVESNEWMSVATDNKKRILIGWTKDGILVVTTDIHYKNSIGECSYVDILKVNREIVLSNEAKKDLMNKISTGYDYVDNYPIIPCDLFVLDNAPTLLYKKSMVLNPFKSYDMNMVMTTMKSGYHGSFEIGEPQNLHYDDLGDSARITLEKNTDITVNVFKELTIHKSTIATKDGKTPKLLMIGDSITHGNNGAQSSPIVKMAELLPSRYNVTPTMIGTFAPYGVDGEGRGCFSFEAMAGLDNNPYNGDFHFPSVGGTLETSTSKVTTIFQNPFTFPATAQDLEDHPEWCFTNSNNYPDETDGVSYADATAEQKANWHFFIFDFDRYVHIWDDENHKPDIITIALGTNDWWPTYHIKMEKTLLAIDIIYTKIREALPNVKILFVSAQGISTTFQTNSAGNWELEIAPLILNIQKKITLWKENGDSNVFELPIYACCSRWLAFDGHTASESTDLSSINTVQKQDIDANVHILDEIGSDAYWEYMECMITAITCLIE